MGEPIPVGLVQASPLIREALAHELAKRSAISHVATYGSTREVLERPLQDPHVLLYEWKTAKRDGMGPIMDLHRRLPHAKILVYNVDDPDQATIECLLMGASGCILEDASLDELLEGIQSVWTGVPAISPRCLTSLMSYVAKRHLEQGHSALALLSRREQEIVQLLAQGLTNKEIGQRLYLRPQTVKNYVHQIFRKLHLHRRLDVIKLLSEAKTLLS